MIGLYYKHVKVVFDDRINDLYFGLYYKSVTIVKYTLN